MVDQGFDPVGGGEGDGPEVGGGAVEGEGYFEAVVRECVDAKYAAGFGAIDLGIGDGDCVSRCERSDRELNGAAMGVDNASFAVELPFALKEMEAGDDGDLEEDALAATAIADGSVGGVRGVAFHNLLSVSEACDRRWARRAVPLLSADSIFDFRGAKTGRNPGAAEECRWQKRTFLRAINTSKVTYSIRCTFRARYFRVTNSGCRTNQRGRICTPAVDFSAFSKQEVL